MAFENGLNSTLPIQGLASTNPVPNYTASVQNANALQNAQIGQTQANTGLTQAQTGLVGQQTVGAGLQNQITQQGLANNQALGQAYAGIPARIAQQTAAANQPVNTGGTTTENVPGGDISNGITATGNPPSTVNVLPPGVQADWAVDKNTDSYVKRNPDGTTSYIPHSEQPQVTPSGRVNMQNLDNINAVYDQAIQTAAKNGGNPAALIAAKQAAIESAQKLDDTAAGIHEKLQTVEASKTTAAKAAQEAQDLAQAHLKNDAFDITHSSDPITELQSKVLAMPKAYAQLGITSGEDWLNPNKQALIANLAQGSATAQKAQETATSKATEESTQTGTTGKKQEIGLTGVEKVADVQAEVAQKSNSLDKTTKALTLAQQFYGSHPTASLNDVENWLGQNPAYAEYKAILSQDNLQAIKESLAGSGRLSQQEFKTLSPTQVNPAMPAKAAIDMLTFNQRLQQQDLQAAQYKAGNIAKITGAATPGLNTQGAAAAAQPTPTQQAANAPKVAKLADVKAQAAKEGVSLEAYRTALVKNGWTVQ